MFLKSTRHQFQVNHEHLQRRFMDGQSRLSDVSVDPLTTQAAAQRIGERRDGDRRSCRSRSRQTLRSYGNDPSSSKRLVVKEIEKP